MTGLLHLPRIPAVPDKAQYTAPDVTLATRLAVVCPKCRMPVLLCYAISEGCRS